MDDADVTGRWTGTWTSFDPAQSAAPPDDERKHMSATVRKEGDLWTAVFEADCARPYKYTVTMEGRRAGTVVMFKGTTDLGPDDGGVYDWIGRATDRAFIGFYTSAHYTGLFSLSREGINRR